MAPPLYKTTVLPIDRSLLFRTSIAKGNPEGVSLLRNAYRSWYFKKRLEEFEAIGVERDLAGMPVARVPAEYLKAQPGTDKHKTVQAFKNMVRGVRRDENEGLVLPSLFDPDTKQQLFEFELLSAGGSRTFDTNSIIQRYEQRILMSVLADFILLGHQGTGSYAMHTDKTGIFRAALNSIAKSIADTLNRHAVPRLFKLNAWQLDELPKFEPTNVDPPDLTQLSSFISATAAAGMQWFPDPDLEKFIREIARLPEMTDEAVEYKRQMLSQEQTMAFAEGQMGLLGMRQKAEMAASGFSPEQAQQMAEATPTELQAQQAEGEMEAQAVRQQHPAHQAEIEEQQMAQPPQEDPNEEVRYQRETEKMELQDEVEDRKHRRTMEQLKAKRDEQKKATPRNEKKGPKR
jgi:hypothetical protein